MSAVYVNNLVINMGTDFERFFTLSNNTGNALLDLTGYTGIAKMAKHANSKNRVAFNVSISAPTAGILSIALSSAQTAALSEGRYVYDIVIDDGFKKTRVIEGMVLVRRGVSV
tara:strand:- start:5320 stop:5658 length:339 start_codon:yes stop_codon:yes gene_type:complete